MLYRYIMTMYEKINRNTWVKKNENSIHMLRKHGFEIKNNTNAGAMQTMWVNKEQFYREFCKKVLKNKKFITIFQLHNDIRIHISNNVTWYRKRMIFLGFIRKEYNLIKPGENLYKSMHLQSSKRSN